MKKITKRQAITWCKLLWVYVKANYKLYLKIKKGKHRSEISNLWLAPLTEVKRLWPGWKIRRKCQLYCPACQHTSEHRLSCRRCVLIKIWPNRCYRSPSPFYNLKSNDLLSKGLYEQNCQQIIDECDRLLAEMGDNNV